MTKYEFLAVMRSLKKLHEAGKPEMALEVIDEVIADATTVGRKSSKNSKSSSSASSDD